MPYEYLLMRSANGLLVHLAMARSETALCGVAITGLEVQVKFGLNGCKRCAKAAVKRGDTHVVEVDGERVSLESVLERPW